MAAALERAEGGGLMSPVIDDNEAGARIATAIRDDECGGKRAAAGTDVEAGGVIPVLRQIRNGSFPIASTVEPLYGLPRDTGLITDRAPNPPGQTLWLEKIKSFQNRSVHPDRRSRLLLRDHGASHGHDPVENRDAHAYCTGVK
jgi:hypothetical protein